MTARLSFGEMLRHAADMSGVQIILATSEDEADLAAMLDGLNSHTRSFDGRILRPL